MAVKQRMCAGCGSREMRRVNRVGTLQRTVLTFLGLYPWECALCRAKRFLRDEGKKRRRTPTVETP